MSEFSNEEKLNILAATRALGFEYHIDASGRLVCTLEQLLEFTAQVASAAVEQFTRDIINASNSSLS